MLKLAYIGNKHQKLEALKFEATDVIAQIKEHRIPDYEKDRLNICIEDINECNDPHELNEWIKDLDKELRFYEEREMEELINSRYYPEDDYGDGYFLKV